MSVHICLIVALEQFINSMLNRSKYYEYVYVCSTMIIWELYCSYSSAPQCDIFPIVCEFIAAIRLHFGVAPISIAIAVAESDADSDDFSCYCCCGAIVLLCGYT